LRDSFDVLHAEGLAGSPKLMSIGLHCRLAGRPGRLAALQRFIEHAQSKGKVWFARRIEIARHWAQHHPPVRLEVIPHELPRDAFASKFGGVFEHSAWIAERAFDAGIGPANDTASGLQAALRTQFRLAGRDERLGVLRAHPDLAGKPAAARRLTPESTREQAGAGLDALTDVERARFTELNNAYMARFGFPFIIAVKGLDKAAILAAFERRIGNEAEEEFAEACAQVERSALLRLKDMLP
jgi:OHCU decarboxylase